MLDVRLAADLTAAIRTGCHLLLVGDTDQLPSVGPGRVLRDLLAVPDIPRTRLTHIFRQDDASAAIIDNAHRILRGLPPLPAPGVFGCHPLENWLCQFPRESFRSDFGSHSGAGIVINVSDF
ncbi:AAA family ATPase [Streptomyces solisilvae]|uniref:AAA family ATPase n=1 Tax=Streptomyces malaysiensis TaxID=92644 RepID=UPI0036CAC2EE